MVDIWPTSAKVFSGMRPVLRFRRPVDQPGRVTADVDHACLPAPARGPGKGRAQAVVELDRGQIPLEPGQVGLKALRDNGTGQEVMIEGGSAGVGDDGTAGTDSPPVRRDDPVSGPPADDDLAHRRVTSTRAPAEEARLASAMASLADPPSGEGNPTS